MAAGHAARHSTHSTDRRLYESGQVSLKDRCPLACMGLHKAAWGQVVLRYICVLVCCCKQLDACANTACQGVCVRIFSKPSIRIDYHHVNVLNNYSKQLYLNFPAQSPLYVVSIPAIEATALQGCTWIISTLAYSLLSF